MPFGGLVVNRVHEPRRSSPTSAVPRRARGRAGRRPGAAGSATSARELAALAARDEAGRRAARRRSSAARRSIVVPELDDDVHDVEGLVQVREYLFAD